MLQQAAIEVGSVQIHHIIEVPDPAGHNGAKGLGEHVLIPVTPAIINAIRHACGAEMTELPATPDKVMTAIHNKPAAAYD